MIGITYKIHDRFSIEFKVWFTSRDKNDEEVPLSDFAINTWMFFPNSLDINGSTYDKTQFHRDIKSNVRLITPDFSLRDLARYDADPYVKLRDAVAHLTEPISKEEEAEYRFQLKLFAAIFKSAVRDEANAIISSFAEYPDNMSLLSQQLQHYAEDSQSALSHFAELRRSIPESQLPPYTYADEFMDNILEIHTARMAEYFEQQQLSYNVREPLVRLAKQLRKNDFDKGYLHVETDGGPEADERNQQLVDRHSMLKKFVEGALYLKVDTHKDGRKVEQFWFGVAAGLAMILSTLIALPFQRYWAGYPALLFAALVIAYGFKDRMKEWLRVLFANQLRNRYFDSKSVVKIKETPAGWIKESVDFVDENKVPAQVMQRRRRNPVENANPMLDEQILFYRKRVRVDADILNSQYSYRFSGINDIMRFHWIHFMQKMVGPEVDLSTVTEDGTVCRIPTERVYTIYIVMQLQCEGQLEYRCFEVASTAEGIKSVTQR